MFLLFGFEFKSILNASRYRREILGMLGTCTARICTQVCTDDGTGIGVIPNLPKCPVPLLMSYRTYRSVRYRYWCCTEVTEVSGTGIDVPSLPKSPVPVWTSVPVPAVPVSMSYRTYRSVRYRYWCRTELTEVSGTGKRRYIPPVCLGTYRTEHT